MCDVGCESGLPQLSSASLPATLANNYEYESNINTRYLTTVPMADRRLVACADVGAAGGSCCLLSGLGLAAVLLQILHCLITSE